MKKSSELKQIRASKIEAQKNLIAEAKQAKRDFNDDENAKFDTLQSEIEDLDKKIARAIQIEEAEKRAAQAQGEPVQAPAIQTKKENQNYSVLRAIRNVVAGKSVDGVEAEAMQEAQKELRQSGLSIPEGAKIAIPGSMMQRDQSVTGDAGAKGGKLVVTEAPRLVAPLFPNNPLSELGITSLNGLVGNVPLLSNTDVTFQWVGENENVTGTDVSFDGPILKPKRIGALVDISEQLIKQSSISIERLVINLLNDAYGRAMAVAVLNGSGVKDPLGILNLTGVGTPAVTTAAAPSFANVVELETLIKAENATEKSLAYVGSKKLAGKLKTTAKVSGTDSTMLLKDGLLNEHKFVGTNLVPELTGNHALIFGDWSQCFTGHWSGLSIKVDPYTQATAGKIRLVVNAYADVQVVHPKAFAINKKLTV